MDVNKADRNLHTTHTAVILYWKHCKRTLGPLRFQCVSVTTEDKKNNTYLHLPEPRQTRP